MTTERVRVGEVLRLQRIPVDPDPLTDYVSIGIRSFGKGIFHYEPLPGDKLGKLRFFGVEPDRLIVSNIKGWEGAVAVSTSDDDGCIASSRFLAYVPIDERISVRWARWFFLSEFGNELLQRASPGSADRNRTLAIDRFEALEIPLLPIDEQQRVATRLDRIDAATSDLGAFRSRAAELANALPVSVCVEAQRGLHLHPTRLGDVLDLVREPTEIDPIAPYVSIGIRSFGAGLFHYPERPGAEIGKLRFHSVHAGLLAISNIKAWEGAVATTSGKDEGTVASNRFLFFRPRAGPDATDFFWARLLDRDGLAHLGSASPGSADRNRTLAIERFNEIRLELPALEDQADIGRHVRAARQAAAEHTAKARNVSTHAAALLPAALNEAFAGLN